MATAFDTNSVHAYGNAATISGAHRYIAPFNVSTREPAAIAYWCRHFNTTATRRLDAVTRVASKPHTSRLEWRAR